MPAKYVRPYSKGQKNDDAEAIAEAMQRPIMKFVATKTADQPAPLTSRKTEIASGSESTTPSRTTDPDWSTPQIDVCFNDASSPT
jgi:hypothetical protein